jgi:hypothetical protein
MTQVAGNNTELTVVGILALARWCEIFTELEPIVFEAIAWAFSIPFEADHHVESPAQILPPIILKPRL